MDEVEAATLYGNLTALSYLCPLAGGYIAGKWLGERASVFVGAAIMALAYFCFFFDTKTAFWIGFCLIPIGNGFFKPAMPTLVGRLYKHGDARRNVGFQIFYMSINVGALISPFIAEWSKGYGWKWMFLSASISLMLASLCFLNGQGSLTRQDNIGLEMKSSVSNKDRVIAIMIVSAIGAFFWMCFHQNGTTLNYFAQSYTNRVVWGYEIPVGWFQALNPLFIIGLVYGFGKTLEKLNISMPTSLVIGMFFAASGFIVLGLGAMPGTLVNPMWLVMSYLLITIGEIFVSPVGLSLINKLAPKHLSSTMIAIWYLAVAAGNKMMGPLAQLWVTWPKWVFFCALGGSLILAGLAMLTQRKRLLFVTSGV